MEKREKFKMPLKWEASHPRDKGKQTGKRGALSPQPTQLDDYTSARCIAKSRRTVPYSNAYQLVRKGPNFWWSPPGRKREQWERGQEGDPRGHPPDVIKLLVG